MKLSRKQTNWKTHARPIIRFDTQELTSFGGLVVLQELMSLRQLLSTGVVERLQIMAPPRITLDFDGSVQSTTRRAQGTAIV